MILTATHLITDRCLLTGTLASIAYDWLTTAGVLHILMRGLLTACLSTAAKLTYNTQERDSTCD